MSTPVQRENRQNVDLLRTHFFGRKEQTSAWVNALSAISLLPGLRGFWPMSAISSAGAAYDVSGNNRTLTNNNVAQFKNVGLAPCIDFVAGSSQYLSRADEAGLDIIGDEAYMRVAKRGLTMGGWFQWDGVGIQEGMMSKWVTANNWSYRLYKTGGNKPVFQVSNTGGAALTVASATAITANPWFFVAGRFDPSTEIKIWVNDNTDILAAGIPATLFNSVANFEIGRTDGSSYMSGEASLCWLCAAFLPDFIINQVYEQTRSLFGV